ncbi:MAG: metallophosphoesterase, partial [Acidobacteria bacterium]|nr:metallophosphoesterase [Acidobacteriota bacterium]
MAGASAVALGIDGFAESNRIALVKLEVPLLRLPAAFDGFSIAQLSDFHYDHFTAAPIQKAVEMVNQLAPDLIVLTGDFVTAPIVEHSLSRKEAAAPIEDCARELERLTAPAGCFAVLGNHDISTDSNRVAHTLAEHRIPVLRNRALALERGRERIWLAGIDDAFKGRADITRTLDPVPANETTILLAHEPDFADVAAHHVIDLQLSGHSHGGQIWVPAVGAPWLPP